MCLMYQGIGRRSHTKDQTAVAGVCADPVDLTETSDRRLLSTIVSRHVCCVRLLPDDRCSCNVTPFAAEPGIARSYALGTVVPAEMRNLTRVHLLYKKDLVARLRIARSDLRIHILLAR